MLSQRINAGHRIRSLLKASIENILLGVGLLVNVVLRGKSRGVKLTQLSNPFQLLRMAKIMFAFAIFGNNVVTDH